MIDPRQVVLNSGNEAAIDDYEERAAILQFEAGYAAARAEMEAARAVVEKYGLTWAGGGK